MRTRRPPTSDRGRPARPGRHGLSALEVAVAAGSLLATLVVPTAGAGATPAVEARRALEASLTRALSPAELGAAGAKESCAEVEQGGLALFQDHPALPVIPASNMKLLTAKAALWRLRPGYRFDTTVLAGSPVSGGVVSGNLYLRGGGDPLLRLPAYADESSPGGGVYTDFAKLPGLLRAAGVREVTGSVLGDGSRYDSERAVASWPARFEAQRDAGPLSALDLDDGFADAGAPVAPGAPPPVQAAGVLTDMLRESGIEVLGGPGEAKTPAGAKALATLVSPPLGAELGEILRQSDNTAMELLTKELGLVQFARGSTAAGTRAVRVDLAAMGLPMAGFANLDGSGLSYQDRVTCRLLLAVLERAGAGGLLVRDLPVAARSGTLVHQLNGTVAAGRVHAKTGNLDGVVALSGWVDPAGRGAPGEAALRQPAAFAVVLNGLPLTLPGPFALVDRVALEIARYPEAEGP